MADVSREERIRIREEFQTALELTRDPEQRLTVSLREGLALLDMATRAVSEETVFAIVLMLDHGEKADRADRVIMMNNLIRLVLRDIGPAAEAVRALRNEGSSG